ncbi:hypothetical protein [Georgenia sp. SUBG003]|uniref:hypothetical protein n=1 Tax=Georgenia sp. SUBG003 TaxID=1497974 RepID=UPI0004DA194E|nr:hypothetical protein DA06_10990 [Georgenia sp. SUBG003]
MSPLFAWPTYREPWSLDVDGLMVDGVFREDLVAEDARRIRIDEAGDWQRAAISLTATPEDKADGIEATGVHILVESPRSNTRIPVPLRADDDGAWVGDVELAREMLGGTVTIVAVVTAQIDDRVRLVGRSDDWKLVVEPGEAPVPPGAPPFAMVWKNFSDTDAPPIARRDPDAHAVMDLSIQPTLYLNDGIEGFRAVLNADTARGERRRARDLLGADVARTALTTLVRAAVEEVEQNATDDDASPPEDHMLRQTLEAVARVGRTTADLEELCGRIAAARQGTLSERLALWTEIDAAIARLSGLPDAVASLAKESRNV